MHLARGLPLADFGATDEQLHATAVSRSRPDMVQPRFKFVSRKVSDISIMPHTRRRRLT
jgi:hypothetical protein